MELKESLEFFSKVAKDFNVVLLAKPAKPLKNCINVKDNLQIFDALQLLQKYDCLVTEKGLVVTRAEAMERPVRVLIFMLTIEMEYSIYKILKQYVNSPESLERLRSFHLNDMIREFFKLSEPFDMQNIYTKRQEMKRDLKAVSSFRNIIMHSNRKMELETEFTVILKRKDQLFKLLDALNQITENIKARKGKWV